MGAIHCDVYAVGRPAMFVHGSFGWGADTFPDQRELADQVKVILIDRRGFGLSSDTQSDGWPSDTRDALELLQSMGPAHLVGQSYGAIVTLLVAATRPDLVLSLVTIEPPMFTLANEDSDCRRIAADTRQVSRRLLTPNFHGAQR